MNPDEFEQALMRDLASASRRDPTPAWKADILARASAPVRRKVITFPRPMLLAWAACWVAVLVLHFMTPSSTPLLTADVSRHVSVPAKAEWRTLETRRQEMFALLASTDSNATAHP